MKDKKDVAVITKTQEMIKNSVESITKEDIKNYFCPLANEKEVFMALGVIRSLNLNPFNREVHLIKYSANDKLSIVVGYEVYIKRAERTGKLDGWKAWIDKQAGTANIVIYRKDWKFPFEWSIKLDEFDKKQSTWKQIPDFMGKKIVIGQGFRLAFSEEIGELPYTEEEHNAYSIGENDKPKIAMPTAINAEGVPAVTDSIPTVNTPAEPEESFTSEPEPSSEPVKTDGKKSINVFVEKITKRAIDIPAGKRTRYLLHCKTTTKGEEIKLCLYDDEKLAKEIDGAAQQKIAIEVLYSESADWGNEVSGVDLLF